MASAFAALSRAARRKLDSWRRQPADAAGGRPHEPTIGCSDPRSSSHEDPARATRRVAHDLKNLMTIIVLNAELLRSASGSEASRAESLTRIRDAAEQAIALTRRLVAANDACTPIDAP